MKKGLILFGLLITLFVAKAQIYHPVHWSYAAKKINKTEAMLFIKAEIENPWHIYSTTQPEGGPIKTTFTFNKAKDYELIGEVTEPKPITKYEDAFKMNVLYFETSVIFQQKIKFRTGSHQKVAVNGTIKFMSCNNTQCLPPETISFNIPIK